MKIILDQLQVQTKQSNEHIVFSDTITYIYTVRLEKENLRWHV